MAVNDDELIAVVGTGDKSGTSFHGAVPTAMGKGEKGRPGGEGMVMLQLEMKMSGWC